MSAKLAPQSNLLELILETFWCLGREKGVFVLVLARFRGLEGVRILTISVFFPSLLFKRHPEGIFCGLLRFLAPFGLPLGGYFVIFSDFLSMSKKARFLNARPCLGGTGRRPHNSLRERLGPCAEVASRRLRQAKAWRGVSTGSRPCRRPPLPSAGLLVYWLAGLMWS